ncbi:MAG: glycosyltransferase [Anaerolineae bacterium]|nr:glycosyltransferase [Anaerolineae bacterium]
MKFLIVAPLHYREELAKARASTRPGEPPPLFPPNMAQSFWVKALRALGHEVHAFYRSESALPILRGASQQRIVRGISQRVPHLNPDYRLRNGRLVQVARDLRPDVLLVTGDNEEIYPQTLAQIKAETGALLVYACGTSPIVFSHANERAAAPLIDLVIAVDYYHGIQWQELGARRMVCLPNTGCDPDFHRPYELSEAERQQWACDVGFVGTLVPGNLYSRRVRGLEALREFDIGIWSVHPVPDSLRPYARGRALGEHMLRILSAAKIAFNTHGDFVYYGGNIRLFELAAIGAFQIADDLPGVRAWFTPGENIVTYADEADLRDKVAYYLAHPEERARIAANAQAHAHANHTYLRRMERLVDEIRLMQSG